MSKAKSNITSRWADSLPAPAHRWFRLAAAIGIPLLLLGLAEAGLRLFGFGYPTDFFLARTIEAQPAIIDNQEFGKRVFPPGLVRFPHPFVMPAAKPTGALRVFVLGESAAMGDPDPKFGLPRMLEVLLQARYPERTVQVVNVSMVAINSHIVLPIARDCVAQKGDLWVIYMGNNEMIGPFGAISAFGAQVPPRPLIQAGLALKRFRLGQLFDRALRSLQKPNPHADWQGMTMWGNRRVRGNDPRAGRVHQSFRNNLEQILAAGQKAGVPMILCTVATNLKDCAPFGSLHKEDLSPAHLADWQAAYDRGIALENQDDWIRAGAAYEQARLLDSEFAELSYRSGRCALALGQTNEASQHFSAARNGDSLQFRADDTVNATIRQCAAAQSGVYLVDGAELLAAESPQHIPGQEFFYEHVHLNPAGNYLLARAAAEKAVAALSAGLTKAGESAAISGQETNLSVSKPWLSLSDCARALGLTDWNRHQMISRVLTERVEQPPFTGQANHAQHIQALRAELEQLRAATKPSQLQRATRQVAQAVAQRPQDLDLRSNFAQLLDLADDVPHAEEQWRTLMKRLPQASLPYYNLGKLLESHGRKDEAQQLYRQCLAIDPQNPQAKRALASAPP